MIISGQEGEGRQNLKSWGLALSFAGVILLLLLTALRIGPNLATSSSRNVQLLTGMCLDDRVCPPAVLNDLTVSTIPPDWLENSAKLTPCQALWASQMVAGQDPTVAQHILAQAADCPRQQLVATWSGLLAWKQGNQVEALAQWKTLPARYLIAWSYEMTLAKDTTLALELLELVNETYEATLSTGERKDLHTKIGHAYRTSEQWTEARKAYRQAWLLAPDDAELAFFYGMSAREAEDPAQAVHIFESGLSFLPTSRASFVADYYIQLGLAYSESSQRDASIEALNQALTWTRLQQQPAPQKEQFILRLISSQYGTP